MHKHTNATIKNTSPVYKFKYKCMTEQDYTELRNIGFVFMRIYIYIYIQLSGSYPEQEAIPGLCRIGVVN